jgi:hypothetical protein
MIARATFVETAIAAAVCLPARAPSQGIASGNVTAVPRARFSGLPFPATFTDVTRDSGLNMTFVQGHPARKKYIIEANGTGVAFLDADGEERLPGSVLMVRSLGSRGQRAYVSDRVGSGEMNANSRLGYAWRGT